MNQASKKFILLTLGDELLLGLTPNSHLTYIGEQLRKHGTTLYSNATISDSSSDIAKHFTEFWDKADIVITTGGLGPTVDDRTKESVAGVLGEALVFDESILTAIQERFASLGLVMTANNHKQAYRFTNGEVLPNSNGTAPGLWLEKDGKILIMLPGPPAELQPMFESQVIPRLESMGAIRDREHFLQLRTIGVGESALETQLQPIFDRYADLEVAYCAHQGQVDLRLSFPGASDTDDKVLEIAQECKDSLGTNFLCYGYDSTVKVVSDILRRKESTLAVAESCTGGMLANAFTETDGASKFFLGGIVCYTNHSKIDLLHVPEDMIHQHTAVSSEVAIAMAAGVAEKMESDYAISATGYTGTKLENNGRHSATVFIGLHTPKGIWSKKLSYRGSREMIRTHVINSALDWLRRTILEEVKEDADSANQELRNESRKILESLS